MTAFRQFRAGASGVVRDVWNSHRGLICILFGGALGGFASTVFPGAENPIADSTSSSAFLGALAAYLFVVLVSNTDRSDTRRLVAIAIVSGLAWQTVIVSVRDSQNFRDDLQVVTQAARTLQTAAGRPRLRPPSVDDGERPDTLADKSTYRAEVDAAFESVVALARDARTGAAQNAVAELLFTGLDHDISDRTPEVIGELRSIGASVDYSRLLPDASEVNLSLNLDEPLEVSASERTEVVVRMAIPRSGLYTVDVASAERDLIASIHSVDTFDLVAANDDSNDSLNPSISMNFESGDYYLRITEFLERNLSAFAVTLSRGEAREPAISETESAIR